MRNHYNYSLDTATNTYNFTTKNNICYKIAFIVDETFSSISTESIPDIFQLVIEKVTDEIEPFDEKVSKTIVTIIELFFQNLKNALIYICDDEDKRAALRHKIFNKWYNDSENRNHIIKMDNVIRFNITSVEIKKLYTSFLLHKQNPNFQKLIDIYNKMEDILNEEK